MIDCYNSNFTILGIDPGNNLGLALVRIDPYTLEINDVYTKTYYLDRVVSSEVSDYFLKRKIYVSKIVNDIFNRYCINAVGIELAFVNTRFPKSAITLSEYISSIERDIYNISSRIKIFKYPPKTVKQLIGATGNSDKEGMLENIKKIDELRHFLNQDLLTEHSVDALSIAYITLQKIRSNLLLCI